MLILHEACHSHPTAVFYLIVEITEVTSGMALLDEMAFYENLDKTPCSSQKRVYLHFLDL
jgi:hypothetical protein